MFHYFLCKLADLHPSMAYHPKASVAGHDKVIPPDWSDYSVPLFFSSISNGESEEDNG